MLWGQGGRVIVGNDRIVDMCRMLALGTLILFLPLSLAYADGVVTFRGDASTYFPGVGKFKEGGPDVATGGRYDPNTYTAALFLDYAKQYRCGYGSGKTCYAVVQEPGGRTLIVLINDNGPLCADPDAKCPRTERVIDLNERSMRYLSNRKLGNGSGLIKNVTVTLLSGSHYTPGPIDETERAQWDQYIFEAPKHDTQSNPYGGQGISTYPGVTAQPYTGTGQLPQPQMTNQLPQPVSATNQQSAAQPVSSLLQDTSGGSSGVGASLLTVLDRGTDGPPASFILLQRKDIIRGDSITVSWAVVGALSSCHAFIEGRGDFASGRQGTKVLSSATLVGGSYTLTIACTKKDGSGMLEKSESLTVR